MRIAVIGAGVAGLGSAYHLARQGHHVEVFEQAPEVGGLTGCFDFDGFRVEKYYHFVCRGDDALEDMLARLGLSGELEWRPTRMAFFYEGSLYPFGTPWELLRFRPISFADRIRFGLNVAVSRSSKSWEAFEGITARDWLIGRIGRHAYDVIWEPLLRVKFGPYHDQVSASWIWHRIHRVARSRGNVLARERLGYLRRGTDVLLQALRADLEKHGVRVRTSTPVAAVRLGGGAVSGIAVGGEVLPFDSVVSTVPLPTLIGLLPEGSAGRLGDVAGIHYISVICTILKVRRPLTKAFWINVNDRRVPFNGFIEYSNLNPRVDAGHPHFLYVPYYLLPEHPRMHADPEEVLRESVAGLRVVCPDFREEDVVGWRVFRDPCAQAICTTHFAQRVPPVRSGISGLFLTDSTQLYPSDRTLSGMFGQALEISRAVAAWSSESAGGGHVHREVAAR